jgi:hypothetical protein
MGMTFGTSVAVNNILALRSFYTFLFNYELHDKPSFVEKLILPRLKKWVADKGWANMCELLRDPAAQTASVTLNDVPSGFFAVLYLIANPHELGSMSTGKELFLLLAQMELDFEKIKKPRESIQNGPR